MTEVVAALIWQGERFMICQRPAHKARGLLWEFVGGKVEPGETKEVILHVRPHELATVDEDGIRKIRAGKFHIYGGFSQPDERSRELTGHACLEEVVTL